VRTGGPAAQRGAVLAGERGMTKDDARSSTRECPDSTGACDCHYQRGVFGALLAASRYCILSVSTTTTSALQRRLVDKAVLAYDEWREECNAVRDAYSRWASAPAPGKGTRRRRASGGARSRRGRGKCLREADRARRRPTGNRLGPPASIATFRLTSERGFPLRHLASVQPTRRVGVMEALAPVQAHAMTLILTP
jgi:hypothetical protein